MVRELLIKCLLAGWIAGCAFGAGGEGGGAVWPGAAWERARPEEVGMDAAELAKAREYALSGQGSGCIIRHGRMVIQWGDQAKRYDLKSSTKAIGVTAVGLALKDGKFKSLDEPAKKYHPGLGVPPESNAKTEWLDKITLFHLATQTAGFEKPGGYEKLLFERVFGPIRVKRSDLTWRNNAYRDHEINGIKRREFGSGISANVDAMARIGYLYLREGRWKDEEIIPSWFVNAARTVPKSIRGLPVVKNETYFNASEHYGLLWWNNADGTIAKVPRDAYWSWGLYDSLIVVIPSLDIVAARAGKSLNKEGNAHYKAIEPFIEPLALSVKSESGRGMMPYPRSPIIKMIEWAPAETIIRKANGGDNWPITWADDDNQYTAYGDGWGFEPKTEKKLSLGIAKVIGAPPDFKGTNIRTESGERVGQGSRGAKASGMLCVDGVLYMLVRNVGNSQIAWSEDRGKTWTWCDWKFTTSFGYPTFLNFGKNYAGARDEYVYVYSPDNDSAYEPADRMVMARVPKEGIREQGAYEFFKGLDDSGRPMWTKDIRGRGAVFENPGKCYRCGISYNVGLRRYLWCQTIYGEDDMRFKGGLGIYDSPEPWGPWTTVYYTEQWDVGPGETSSFPTKWMSEDGRSCHLVFSGEDCLSVRKVKLTD
jgi:CubicO group peptidase (beta-lactamase class C family)